MTDIIEALARHASDQPDAQLYTFLDAGGRVTESHTYGGFDARTTALAAGLLHAGRVAPGEHVLLVYPPGLDFISAFFACVKLGAVPVPVAPPDASGFIGGVERLAYMASDASVRVALTTDACHQQMRRLAERSAEGDAGLRREPLSSVAWVATDMIAGGPSLPPSPAVRSRNPLLFLQYTSGSTQRPRGVMVSHDNVTHNAWATLQHRPTGVSWLPHYHDMGLIGYYLFIMITGGSMYGFSGAHFLKRPLLWLETISRFRGTITSAPNFAFEYCLREDKVPEEKLASLDLSSMVCMMNASEPVRASTYERFQARFGRCGLSPQAHMVFYGLAEHTLSVTGNGRVALTVNTSLLEQNQLKIEASRPDGFNQARLMSCGRPLAGVDVRIVAAGARAALADDLIGEIWVGGPSKAAGYLNKPALSELHFGATIDGADGATYLRTGDIGFIHEGELFICGRLKDVIIIGGRNYYPADIEAVVEAASPKVRTGCVAAFAVDKGPDGEGIAVVAEPRRANDLPDLEAICREIRKRCQIEVDILAIVPHGAISKTSSGKIARQACRRSWAAGEVRVIASRTRPSRPGADEVLDDLLNRLAGEEYEERTLADLGIDSLTLVELSLHLEQLFDSPGPAGGRAAETWSDLRILQAITVGELRALVSACAASGEMPQIVPELLEARLESIDRDELERMREDARLPAHIVPGPTPAAVPPDATVLLTGATGFLGSFLLEALLRLTQYRVVTLVRATSADHARTRTESALERTGLLDQRLRDAFAARVRFLAGDLSQPRLGLAPDDWTLLSEDLSAIYHCGADVDYVKPYEMLRGANVSSAVEIVGLASSRRPKALHYVSTTFMFGFVAREICLETDANLEMAGLNFGYAQSKWVAEQLVLDAGARGLTARVYRPSLVTASHYGKYLRRDLMSRILSYMIRHGVAVSSANQISFIPVDVCANNIVALSLLGAAAPAVVHITADHYYTMVDVCAAMTRQSGFVFEHVTLERFMEYLNAHCAKNDPMFPLLAFFNQNWRRIDMMRDKRYDSAHYRQARAASPLAVPEPSLEDTVGQIVAFLQNENLVPGPRTQNVSVV